MDYFDREQIERLPAVVIFKWIGIGSLAVCMPYQLLMGLLGACGYHTVSWSGAPVTGFHALWFAPLLGLMVAMILTLCIGTGCLAARWVFSQMDESASAEPTDAEDASPITGPTP